MESEHQMICTKCNCSMRPAEVRFSYLGNYCSLDAYRCPECGQVWIPESLVDGNMHKYETILEDRRMRQE